MNLLWIFPVFLSISFVYRMKWSNLIWKSSEWSKDGNRSDSRTVSGSERMLEMILLFTVLDKLSEPSEIIWYFFLVLLPFRVFHSYIYVTAKQINFPGCFTNSSGPEKIVMFPITLLTHFFGANPKVLLSLFQSIKLFCDRLTDY